MTTTAPTARPIYDRPANVPWTRKPDRLSPDTNPETAAAFIDFLLSPAGQEILLDPKIRRLPVNPATYAKAPKDFPNPFEESSIGAQVKFDVDKSKARYNLVNSLFDVMITYRLEDLQDATQAIQQAEAALTGSDNAEARALIDEAKALVAALPIDEAKAMDPEFAAIFKKKRKKKTDKVAGRQAEVEQEWDSLVKANYERARELAEQAKGLLGNGSLITWTSQDAGVRSWWTTTIGAVSRLTPRVRRCDCCSIQRNWCRCRVNGCRQTMKGWPSTLSLRHQDSGTR